MLDAYSGSCVSDRWCLSIDSHVSPVVPLIGFLRCNRYSVDDLVRSLRRRVQKDKHDAHSTKLSLLTGIKIPAVPHGRAITMLCIFLNVLALLIFGKLTDYVRKYGRVMLAAAVILAVSAMPMFAILNIGGVNCDKYVQKMINQSQNQDTCVIIGGNFSHCPPSPVSETASIAATFGSQLFLFIVLSMYGSALPVWMVTSFPPEVRYTAVGLGYNLAMALLGGTAPLIATTLIDVSHWNVSPSIFLIIIATLSASTLVYLEFENRQKQKR